MYVFENYYIQSDKQTFLDKVNSYSYKLGINPNWLMYVMYSESGLNPHICAEYHTFTGCGGGKSCGLIGFTPCTQQGLGWTKGWEAFKNQSGTEQMEYVYKLYKPYAGKIKSYADLYLVAAFPLALGKPLDWVFQSPKEGITPEEYVKGNPNFDFMPKDGKVTLKEFYEYQDNRVRSKVPSAFLPEFINTESSGTGIEQTVEWNYVKRHERDIILIGLILAVLAMIGLITYFLLKK